MQPDENNILAAGGIFAALITAGLDPVIVEHNGLATNTMTVRLGYMKSRYRITVERIPGTEQAGGEDDPDDVVSAATEIWTALGDGEQPPHRVWRNGEIVPAGVCVLQDDGEIGYLDDTGDCACDEGEECDCSHEVLNRNMGALVEVTLPDYETAVAADRRMRRGRHPAVAAAAAGRLTEAEGSAS